MLSSAYDILVHQNKEEQIQRGTTQFPCAAYRGDVRKFPMGYLPVHWHRELEVFVLEEGKVKLSTGHEEFILHAGEGYFSNSGTLHGIYPLTKTPCNFHSIVFDASLIAGATGSIYDMKYMRPFLSEGVSICPLLDNDSTGNAVLQAFEEAFSLCVEESNCYEIFVREQLSRIIVALRGTMLPSPDAGWSVQVQRIKQMVAWIEQNYEQPITVEQIASTQGISVRECQRTFQKIMNTTPMQYAIHHRIVVATNLLKNTDYCISEIASSCGFDSSSYFAKQFKHMMGMTPKQYRNKETKNEI